MRAFSLSVEIDSVLDGLGDKQEDFVKEAVIEKAQREGLLNSFDRLPELKSKPLSIGDQLNQRERVLLDGPTDLSERSVRKAIALKTL